MLKVRNMLVKRKILSEKKNMRMMMRYVLVCSRRRCWMQRLKPTAEGSRP
jgi:hypothetical protein